MLRVVRGRQSSVIFITCMNHGRAVGSMHMYTTASGTPSSDLSPFQRLKLWLEPFTNGAKELIQENKEAFASRRRLYELPNTILNRREMFVLRQAPRDLLKSIPLLLMFGVPMLGNIAPIIGYKFPKLTLPWQFWTAEQKAEFFSQDIAKKSSYYGAIAKLVAEWDPSFANIHAAYNDSSLPQANIEPKLFIQYLTKFESQGALHELPSHHLKLLVLATSASPFVKLYTYFPRAKLIDRLELRALEIGIDDRLLLKEGLDALSLSELVFACEERGLSADFKDASSCQDTLKQWLSMYDPKAPATYPPSFLLHAPILVQYLLRWFYTLMYHISSRRFLVHFHLLISSPITAPMSRGISRSARRLGDDHHHEHLVFEEGPFNAKSIGAGILAIVGGGAVVTVGCCKFQNYKHGFPQKKEE
ncbi:hypothetical protein THRCLA_04457 [Thraustotheca clavata]|uniref:Letm1 RBD domain-containing protein n=1 Tax=Thraustotheca clavata TaxID=74557 RepID=A0A1V9ZZ01_9STRA|nr:hypothetical protein THRCLA_04457 [Thraustotheca clavata]